MRSHNQLIVYLINLSTSVRMNILIKYQEIAREKVGCDGNENLHVDHGSTELDRMCRKN